MISSGYGLSGARRAVIATAMVLAVVGGSSAVLPAASAVAAPPPCRPAPGAAALTDSAAGTASASRTNPHTPPNGAALSAAIAGLPAPHTTAALVRVGGDGSWRGSSGVRDLRSGRPALPDGRFRAGSTTKVFVAAVVLQLAAEGKVSLDAAARSYLPELIPPAYGAVTVRQLLNHTHGIPAAGLPGATPEEAYAHRFDRHDPRDLVRSATARPPEFRPGSCQRYHNMGYTIAGLLIERITGDSYEAQVTRRILRPLGLRDSYLPAGEVHIRGPHNRGYQSLKTGDGTATELRDVTRWDPTDSWAAGDLISTTADLERFITALFQGRVVRGPLLEEMFTLPAVPDRQTGAPAAFSVGLSVQQLGGREVWGKTGGRYGYNTAMAATRDLSRTLVYSVNATNAKARDTNQVAGALAVATFGRP
ncbi:serine hydrolase domain-containing protein [Streptomyces sp. NPDC017979]|uniref:serine hydrolase domain-containing protein n=1 Tax=Streptomyces sp. NPDC017979 TaxID=3365024 RepID=UPI0037B4BD39